MNTDRARARILIVDDISENIELLEAALHEEYEIQFALSGERALALIAESPPDLVLLDIMMPGMDGLETLRRIKALPDADVLPVILLTSDTRLETQLEGLELGAADFVTRPVELPALRARARNVLERQRLIREQQRLLASLQSANEEIERLLQFKELLLSAAGEGICGVDLAGRTTFINPSALAMVGFEKREAIGQDLHQLLHQAAADGSPSPPAENPVAQTLSDGLRRDADDFFVCRNGSRLPVHLTVTPLIKSGKTVGAEVVFLDISQRQRLEKELLHLATTDALTEVPNQRLFLQTADAELARVRRYACPAGLLMVDLDQFRAVNDRYGHAAGDAVLREFAHFSRERLRAVDTIGRVGGDEFAILLPDTSLFGATVIAQQLCEQTAAHPVSTPQGLVSISISIGVTEMLPEDTLLDSVLARADAVLYAAKRLGRNRVEVAYVPSDAVVAAAPPAREASAERQQAPATALQILDLELALERLEGDRPLLMLAAQPLPAQIAGDRTAMAEAVRTADSGALRKAAHRLRGSLGVVGAQRAFAACAALEEAAKDGQSDAFASKLAALEAELEALQPLLAALLSPANSSPRI